MPFITTMNGTMYHPSQAKKSASACKHRHRSASAGRHSAKARRRQNGYYFVTMPQRMESGQEGGRPISRDMVNGERLRDVGGRVDLARRRASPPACRSTMPGNSPNAMLAVEEGRDGDLIGGVERRRRPLPLRQRLAGDAQAPGSARDRRASKVSLRQGDEIGRGDAARRPDRDRRGNGRPPCACRDWRGRRSWSRRRRRSARARSIADARRRRACPASMANR